MKKSICVLLAAAISISTLTACAGKSAEDPISPMKETTTVVAPAQTPPDVAPPQTPPTAAPAQTSSAVAPAQTPPAVAPAQTTPSDYSQYTPVTDKAEISQLTFFMDLFTGVPVFPEISLISRKWLVEKYFLFTEDSFFDETLYNTYGKEIFTKLSSIERLAQEQINPDIRLKADDQFDALDGSNILTPLWIPEAEAFGWNGFGGYFGLYKCYPMEIFQNGNRYYVKSIDMYLSYSQEYFEDEQPRGTVSVHSATDSKTWLEAGDFADNDGTIHYSMTANENELQQSWYELEKMPSGDFCLISKSPVNWQN